MAKKLFLQVKKNAPHCHFQRVIDAKGSTRLVHVAPGAKLEVSEAEHKKWLEDYAPHVVSVDGGPSAPDATKSQEDKKAADAWKAKLLGMKRADLNALADENDFDGDSEKAKADELVAFLITKQPEE